VKEVADRHRLVAYYTKHFGVTNTYRALPNFYLDYRGPIFNGRGKTARKRSERSGKEKDRLFVNTYPSGVLLS